MGSQFSSAEVKSKQALLVVWRDEIFPAESDNIALKDYSLERQRALAWEHWRNEASQKEKNNNNNNNPAVKSLEDLRRKRFRQVENVGIVQFVLGLKQETKTFTVSPMSLFMCDSFCLLIDAT